MLAAKHFDIVMGIDVHLVIIPPATAPIPMPHPFIGMVFDPIELIPHPFTEATVYVNGIPRAQAGTGGKNVPSHIPMGANFATPPLVANEGEMFMGSNSVLAEGEPFTYLGLPVLTCSDIGAPSPPRAKKPDSGKTISLPTSVVLAIPMGYPVLVGGTPTISLMGMAFKFGLSVLKKLGGRFRKWQKNSDAWKNLSKKVHDLGEKAFKKAPDNLRNKMHRAICAVTGHPVDIATGKVFTEHTDFELPGPIPLKWERVWYSTSSYQGGLGHGWHHPYDMYLHLLPHTDSLERKTLVLRLADGRSIVFPQLEIGEGSYNLQERLSLQRDEEGYVLKDKDNLSYYFHPIKHYNSQQKLQSIRNLSGQSIRFSYDAEGDLQEIQDSAGRILQVHTNFAGKITQILAPHPEKPGEIFPLVRYQYNEMGDLVEVLDALDQSFYYTYQNHLLVKETNRNGLSFYFEYDGDNQDAYCTRTWGDGGIYDHKLVYNREEKYTIVENSLGHITYYYWNDDGLVFKEVGPEGHEKLTRYGSYCQVLQEVDELGQSTRYEYDERGNRTRIIKADNTQINLQYDGKGNLSRFQNEMQASWTFSYNEQGQLIERGDPEGNYTRYAYEDGQLVQVIDPLSNQSTLHYDEHYNLVKVIGANGAESQWKYDSLGNCIAAIDPKGNRQVRKFDLLGRITELKEPDGNLRQLQYDGEGHVAWAKDEQHEVHFAYQGMGRLSSRKEAGTEVKFLYDTEEDLIGIKNEEGSLYSFLLDHQGRVIKESGFDGLTRYYFRDAGGRVQRVERPGGLETHYVYDKIGRVKRVQHSDGTGEYYQYRADGELLVAENEHGLISFERDTLGRVLKERQNGVEVCSEYNALGQKTWLSSSLGTYVNFDRDVWGDLAQIKAWEDKDISTYAPSQFQAPEDWLMQTQNDLLGLELERILPGGVKCRWERDKLGRPLEQKLSHKSQKGPSITRKRQYTWGSNERLRQILDSSQGLTQFEHDVLGNLSAAQYGDGSTEYRMPDVVGNLFKSKDRKGRKYNEAGALLEAEGTKFRYDGEGNLIEKKTKKGETWKYQWNASGMLAKVVRPDHQEVTFTYDALGRRLSKTFRNKTTHWAWDGNNPLHEWTEEKVKTRVYADDDIQAALLRKEDLKDLSTWLFEPEGYAPLAKFTENHQYSIVPDHLGTPLSMFDEQGTEVWNRELSIYGKVRKLKGWREACPFMYPGQYEDLETGLYYNRFRYYDPEMGGYVSQDPIGLAGGNPTIYGYVKDVNGWVDVFGLSCKLKGTDKLDDLTITPHYKGQPQGGLTQAFTIKNDVFHIDGKPANFDGDFVIKSDGSMILGKGHYHLSSSADTVKGAGQIGIDNGKITYLDNQSGHYLPEIKQTASMANVFKENNLIGEGFQIFKLH